MELPLAYRWLKANGFGGLLPWYFIEPEQADALRKQYQAETGSDIIPFAQRQDNDDIAGFEVSEGQVKQAVNTTHLSWTGKREQQGWLRSQRSEDIFEWLSNTVLPATKDWMNEAELRDLLEENKSSR